MPEVPAECCIWDRLPGLDAQLSPDQHRRRRIEPFETLSGPPAPEGLADPEPFAAEIRRRLACWELCAAPPGQPEGSWGSRVGRWWPDVLWFLGISLTYIWTTLGILVLIALGVTWLAWWRTSRLERLRRALDRRRCPDCHYDLTGTPSGLDPGLLGVDPGPRRCPECGSAWPLLPPAPPRPPPLHPNARPAGEAGGTPTLPHRPNRA